MSKFFNYNAVAKPLYIIAEKADCVVFSGTNLISRGIQIAEDSMWNHVAEYVGGHKIVEAVASGVKEHPLNNYFDGDTIIMVRRINGITVDQVAKMMQKIYVGPNKEFGKKYDYQQILGALFHILTGGWIAKNVLDRPNYDICSEMYNNTATFAGFTLNPELQDVRVPYPKDLAITNEMHTIAYLNPRTKNFITDINVLAAMDRDAADKNGDWLV